MMTKMMLMLGMMVTGHQSYHSCEDNDFDKDDDDNGHDHDHSNNDM